MSAPAGWHLQPDGRERFWDGTRWTEQFRMPAPSDPTAPPPPSWAQPGDASGSDAEGDTGDQPFTTDPTADTSSWQSAAPTVDQTQALDVTSTQAIPAHQPPAGAPGWQGQPPATPYTPGPDYTYGAPGGAVPASGYGAPGWQGQPPATRGSSGLAKGCLIAALVGVVFLVIAVVAAIFFVSRAVDEVTQTFPTSIPSGLPTGLPTDLPSGLPTEGLGERIGITVGDGFDIPRATIQDGWSLAKQGAGSLSIVTIDDMRATLEGDDGLPVLFTVSFPTPDGASVETVCTAPGGAAGATVEVSCVPLLGDVSQARQGTVTTTL